jgi:hypothetical protein
LMGLRPLTPGFQRLELRPQLADLESIDLTAHTLRGPVRLSARGPLGNREVTVELPSTCEGELVLSAEEMVAFERIKGGAPPGNRRYRLPSGQPVSIHLKHG